MKATSQIKPGTRDKVRGAKVNMSNPSTVQVRLLPILVKELRQLQRERKLRTGTLASINILANELLYKQIQMLKNPIDPDKKHA
jgi:hypothetical protein